MKAVTEALKMNAYPGRGIILGVTPDGENGVIAYFIMGRSENSRNRIFVATDSGIRTEAYDEAKLTDPSLVIYTPVRHTAYGSIVTNGDQTDTLYDYLTAGKRFQEALDTRTFEPDPPIYTPRISGLLTCEDGHFAYKLSILKSGEGDPGCTRRFLYDYAAVRAGEGHLIHTYKGDGNPVPSFTGEPVSIQTDNCMQTFTDTLWDVLNHENRVALYVCYQDRTTGKCQSMIINKHSEREECTHE